MDSEKDKELFAAFLKSELTDEERENLERQLEESSEMSRELRDLEEIWDRADEIGSPEPSDNMSVKFYAMLNTMKAAQESKRNPLAVWWNNLNANVFPQPWFRMAYTLVILAGGLGIGYLLRPGSEEHREVQQLSEEVKEMKQMMMLSMLENPSATERIKAVSYTNELDRVDRKVIEALFATLNNDDNDNVRLMTLEALVKMADDPAVREGLVQSISRQASPLVQSAMADVMVKLQEKKAVKPLRKLLKQNNLNDFVKTKIETSIHEII